MDAGGVLFNNVTEETEFLPALARRHGADPAELRRQLDRRDSGYETGDRHVHAVLADCLTAAGAKASGLEQEWTDALYLESVRAYKVAFEAVRKLRSQHLGLVLALANNEAEHWDRLKNERYGHLTLFDIVGSSWRLGAVKPGPEYFARLLALCGCVPAEAVLVDDNPGNVDAARRFGLTSVCITAPAELPAVLAALNSGELPTV